MTKFGSGKNIPEDNMSWDSYIDSLIGYSRDAKGVGHIDKACIIGMDGGLWTSPKHKSGLKPSKDECVNIAKNVKAGEQGHNFFNGIFVAATKYQMLRFDGDSKLVLGKKQGSGAITIQASKTAIVIAHCTEGGQHGQCNNSVAKVVEHLKASGY